MTIQNVRVRFAPSPTGYLHIGGVRTALYNWLFARQNKGVFILRIEDTDLSRSTDEAIGWILDGLRWMGLDWDEGPFRQTERFGLYQEHIERLLAQGKAYRCYCTPEELEVMRKAAMARGKDPKYDGRCRRLKEGERTGEHTIRFKAPQEGQIVVDDLIRGAVMFDESQMDDLIIRRSDGTPTYNFTVVVDDALMSVTHVIRGEDHLSNTPRQIQLYQAMGYEVPRFGHMSLMLGTDREKLSKRHGAASVAEFADLGYLPEALINYLVRLGWSHGDQEIFSLEEVLAHWSLQEVKKSPAVFDHDKLKWLNAHYIKTLPAEDVTARLVPFLRRNGLAPEPPDPAWLVKAVLTLRERATTLVEMADKMDFYFRELEYEAEPAQKFLTAEVEPLMGRAAEFLSGVAPFEHQTLHDGVRAWLDAEGVKLKTLAQPLRVALTYRKDSPGLFEVMEVLGKRSTLERIEKAREWIKSRL